MITYDPKNWLAILRDLPRSPVFRTLALDVLGAGAWAALVTWLEQKGEGAEIRARKVHRTSGAEPSIKIADSSSARAAGFARMARSGPDVWFAWTETSGDSKRVQVARMKW